MSVKQKNQSLMERVQRDAWRADAFATANHLNQQGLADFLVVDRRSLGTFLNQSDDIYTWSDERIVALCEIIEARCCCMGLISLKPVNCGVTYSDMWLNNSILALRRLRGEEFPSPEGLEPLGLLALQAACSPIEIREKLISMVLLSYGAQLDAKSHAGEWLVNRATRDSLQRVIESIDRLVVEGEKLSGPLLHKVLGYSGVCRFRLGKRLGRQDLSEDGRRRMRDAAELNHDFVDGHFANLLITTEEDLLEGRADPSSLAVISKNRKNPLMCHWWQRLELPCLGRLLGFVGILFIFASLIAPEIYQGGRASGELTSVIVGSEFHHGQVDNTNGTNERQSSHEIPMKEFFKNGESSFKVAREDRGTNSDPERIVGSEWDAGMEWDISARRPNLNDQYGIVGSEKNCVVSALPVLESAGVITFVPVIFEQTQGYAGSFTVEGET